MKGSLLLCRGSPGPAHHYATGGMQCFALNTFQYIAIGHLGIGRARFISLIGNPHTAAERAATQWTHRQHRQRRNPNMHGQRGQHGRHDQHGQHGRHGRQFTGGIGNYLMK